MAALAYALIAVVFGSLAAGEWAKRGKIVAGGIEPETNKLPRSLRQRRANA